jgi:DNA-binding Lrp family transcriptional regulator
VLFRSKNAIAFDKFFTAFLEKYSQYLRERDIIVITENHSCPKAYLFDKAEDDTPDTYYGGEPESSSDETELKILKALSNDAKASMQTIASSVGLTGEAVAHRVKQLQRKNIIQSLRPIVNTRLLGYQYYNILFRLKKFNHLQKIFGYAKKHPNVIYFVKYLGSYDIGMDVEVKNTDELREVLQQIKDVFNEDIESYMSVLVFQEHKLSYLPI